MATDETTHEIISRKDAIAKGLKFYFLAEPCKNGHFEQRRVASRTCKQCEYLRTKNWRAANKAHVREHANSYRAENADRFRSQERARYAKDPAKFVEKTRRSYWKKPEEYRAKSNKLYYESYRDPEVRKRAQERAREWAIENPERAKASRRNAKVKRRNLDTQGAHTADDIREIFKLQRGKCAYCRVAMGKKYTVDHITALAKGGTNDRRNLQLTCMPCNREKWARDPIFHARTLGLLI
jgi:5-methylcytosine-specific restriction endonuclease McrA